MISVHPALKSAAFLAALCCGILSCGTDHEAPCGGEAPEGEICREYRYGDGDYIGYVEYRYAEGLLSEKTFYTGKGEVNSYVRIEQDAQGLFRKESTFRASDHFLTECRAYQYDASGRLTGASVTVPSGVQYISYDYDTAGRLAKSVLHINSAVTSFTVYMYNTNDSLYKTMTYAAADSILLSHSRHSYFDAALRRDFYTGDHRFDGHEVVLYGGGSVVFRGSYGANGAVVAEDEYEYDRRGRLAAHTRTEAARGAVFRALYLYR